MKGIKNISVVLLLLTLSSNTALYAATIPTVGEVQANITAVQNINGSLPTTQGEPKGQIGAIIAGLFDASGRIKNEFLSFLSNLGAGDANKVVKWDGTTFQPSNIYEVGGNVGIGIANPTSQFQVAGNISTTGTITASDFIKIDGSSLGGKFVDGTNSVDAVYTTGKVGIGTTSPRAELDISGGMSFAVASPLKSNGVGYLTDSQIFDYTNDSGTYKINHYGMTVTSLPTSAATYISGHGELGLFAGSQNRLHIENNGNVGIGTTSPNSKLHVEGSGYFQGNVSVAGNTINLGGASAIYRPSAGGSIAFGNGLRWSSSSASNNTSIGVENMKYNSGGNSNTAVGTSALRANTSGNSNTAIGYRSLSENKSGSNNTASGREALLGNSTGSNNVAMGFSSLRGNKSGSNNVANGVNALLWNNTGYNNVAIGHTSMMSNKGGHDNTANGIGSLAFNQSGNHNTANGFQALYFTSTSYNTANGSAALRYNTSGEHNTANGASALYFNRTGSYNTATGYKALTAAQYGSYNTALGYLAGSNITTGTHNIVIGDNAQVPSASGNNQISIGNLIYGINSNVGIGTTSPSSKLEVAGNIEADSFCDTSGANCFTAASVGGSSSPWVESGTNVYRGSGKVGIGTTSPSARLSIGGGTNAGTPAEELELKQLSLQPPSHGGGPWNIFTRDKGSYAYLDFGYNNVKALTIRHDGNVGIGTTSPTQKLDVNGNAAAIKLLAGDGTAAGPSIAFRGDTGVNTGLYLPAQNEIGVSVNGVERMRIQSDGNVGIGTISPSAKLDVAGMIEHSGSMRSSGTNYKSEWMRFNEHQYGNSLILGAGGLTVIGAGESSIAVKNAVAANIENMYIASDSGIKLLTNMQSGWAARKEAMTILSNANIGIGTTSPSSKLEVAGNIEADSFCDTSGANCFTAASVGGSSSPWGESGANVYRGSGKVGIGTNAPKTTLDVRGSVTLGGERTGAIGQNSVSIGVDHTVTGSAATAIGRYNTASSVGAIAMGWGTEASGNHSVSMGNSTTASGPNSVAMGWNSLAFGSASTAMGSHTYARGDLSTVIGEYNVGLVESLFEIGNGGFGFRKNAFTVLYSGNVGIGIDAPTQKLHINGTALATAWNTTSDLRLKTNIQTIEDPVAKIQLLNGVSFDWKDSEKGASIGVIAQDVETVFPDLVNNSGEYKSVNYGGLVAPLIEAVKEQQKQIDALQIEVELLREEVSLSK